jgi:replicative DNA helicase
MIAADTLAFVDISLERQVLGQMLRCRGVFDQYLAAGLQPDDFYREVHRWVFASIVAVEAAGVHGDLVTVGLELRRTGVLEEVNAAYFSMLVDDVVTPSAEAVQSLSRALAELATKRTIQRAIGDPDASLTDLSAAIEATASRGGDGQRVYDAQAQLATITADMDRDRAGRVWLGLPTLDNILEGLRPGEVFGLMARPGIGKTLVLGHVARSIADADLGHVFFSLEMPAAQIVERVARAHYGLTREQFRDRLKAGVLDTDSYHQTFKHTVLVDAPGLDIARMAARIRQLQATTLKKSGVRLITVDHLGLVGGDRKMTTYDRVSMQARELKELAKRFDATVLLAVQVNREAGGDGSKELGLGAARDSGVVEEAMDYLVAMRRLDRSQTLGAAERQVYRDVLFAKVVKNRHGSPDTEIAIRFDPKTLELREDTSMVAEADDLGRIAASAGRRR